MCEKEKEQKRGEEKRGEMRREDRILTVRLLFYLKLQKLMILDVSFMRLCRLQMLETSSLDELAMLVILTLCFTLNFAFLTFKTLRVQSYLAMFPF